MHWYLQLVNNILHNWLWCGVPSPPDQFEESIKSIDQWEVKSIDQREAASITWHPPASHTAGRGRPGRGKCQGRAQCEPRYTPGPAPMRREYLTLIVQLESNILVTWSYRPKEIILPGPGAGTEEVWSAHSRTCPSDTGEPQSTSQPCHCTLQTYADCSRSWKSTDVFWMWGPLSWKKHFENHLHCVTSEWAGLNPGQ